MANLLNPMPIPFEPKKKNRFLFTFPSELGINQWYIESGARPKFNVNPVAIPYLNFEVYVAGRVTFDPISVTFRDPIGPSASQALMEWVRLCAETVTGRMGYAAGYKKDVYIEMLDPNGVTIEKWLLQGTFLSDVNFGDLAYTDDGLATINATLRYDRPIHLF